MCGIAGFYSFVKNFHKEDLRGMINTLVHRGPDAEGIFIDDKAGLGHRRLSVVDLSSVANQPFYSSSGRYVMTYNGEVYNARDLAIQFNILPLRTTSDTEAILELFEQLGPQVIAQLNGMYSIAIYDTEQKELHMFRDRIGIKPIYYYLDSNCFVFASEIKALVALPYIKQKLEVNTDAIASFLHLAFIPEPQTIYKNIGKFPSGSYSKVSSTGVAWEKYYDVNEKVVEKQNYSFEESKTTLRKLLESSVQYRLMSDVPTGVFLSGGVDSSLIAAIAREKSSKPVKTFSLGFDEDTHNEIPYARKISTYLNTEHYDIVVSQRDILDCWEKVLDNFDEPFGDSSAFPTYLLSRFAKEKITVALSGEGSDELFMGYGSYQWAKKIGNYFQHAQVRKALSKILKLGNNRYKRAARLFDFSNGDNSKSHIFSQEHYYFSEDELKRILKPEYYEAPMIRQNFSGLGRKLSHREEQALFDLNYYVKEDLLMKIDHASMLTAVEVRVPYLDYRIIEFALNLSEDYKVRGNKAKFILRELLNDHFPEDFFNRPKRGFSIPLKKWMKHEWRFILDDYLSSENIKKTGFFYDKEVQQMKSRFLLGNEDYLFHRLYLMAILQRWFLKNLH